MSNLSLTTLELAEVSYQMYLPDAATDYIQQKITQDKQPYEYGMLRDMASHLGKKDIFVDAGANIGNHTLYLAAATGCEVHAFEPNVHLAAALEQSVAVNQFQKKVTVHQLGLGQVAGEATFDHLDPSNLGALLMQDDSTATSLDNLQLGKSVKVIRIQSSENVLSILKGAIKCLQKAKPAIYVECKTKDSFSAVTSFLAEQKYGCMNSFSTNQTHLFLPIEKLALKQEIPSVATRYVEQAYELSEKISELNTRLKSANDKFRIASLEVETAKRQIEQQTQKYATQKEVIQTLEQNNPEVKELEKRLAEANEKYRLSCQHIELEKTKKQQLNDQLQEKQQLWLAANQKYKEATEQIAKLKQSLQQANDPESAEAKQLIQRLYQDVLAGESSGEFNIDLTNTLQQLTVIELCIQQLRQQRQQALEQCQLLTRQLADTETQLAKSAAELAEGSIQRQLATEQITSLKQQATEAEQQLATQTLALANLQHALAEAGQVQQEQTQQLADSQQALTTAAALQQQSADEIYLLQQELLGSHEENQQLTEQLAETSAELEQTIQLRTDAQHHVQQIHGLMQQRTVELAQLKTETAVQKQQLATLTEDYQQLCHIQQHHEQQSIEQQQQLAAAKADQLNLQQKLQQKTTAADAEIAELQQQLLLLQELHQVKHRAAVLSPQYQQLAEQLKTQTSSTAQVQSTLQELQLQLDQNQADLKNAHKQLKQKQQLETQVQSLQLQLAAKSEQELKLKQQHIDDRSELDLFKALQKIQPKALETNLPPQLPAALQPVFEQLSRQQQMVAQLKQRKVACIMDEFTFGSYAPEANLLQLTPQHWQRELEGFQPDVLFIESAWRGKHEIWGNKVGHKAQELVAIVQWCNQRKIPTLFWNKEDPVHFETFISTAKLFDFVFTTDFDCIHRYKAALEHERVYLLPFAAQPTVNNPIELYTRKDAFCFAGAYYVRYPDRTRDLDDFLQHLPQYKPVEIYDRNFGKDDPNYMFPESYQPFIVGNLPYEQIDKAYKGYRYAINLNSIKHSQTMFARRAYELLASNTLTVSNYSRGIELMFGDLVLNSDSGQQIVDRLQQIEQDPLYCQKFQLTALRKVMTHHTYQDRLGYILDKIDHAAPQQLLPQVVVAAYASTTERAARILNCFQQQNYQHKQLLLVVAEQAQLPESLPEAVTLLTAEALKGQRFEQLFPSGSWFGFMVADDYYGPNYLTDLALATRYSPAPMIGKVAHYRYLNDDEIRANNLKNKYRFTQKMEARSGIFRTDLYPSQKMYDWLRKAYQLELEQLQILAIDPFNYCKALPLDVDFAKVQPLVDDAILIAAGMPYLQLQQQAEQLAPQAAVELDLPALSAVDLQQLFAGNAAKAKVKLDFQPNYIEVTSDLADGKHEYLYADRVLPLSELVLEQNGQFDFLLEATTGMNLQMLVVFLAHDKTKISHEIKYANKNNSLTVPEGCEFVQLALRFYASGACNIKRLVLQHLAQEPQLLLPQADYLLLTNHYPSYQDLYRNGFVHTRVKAYRDHGVAVDVCRLRKDDPVSWHEYQGVQVCTLSQQALRKTLENGRYKHILVHFLDAEMWEVLKDFVDDIRVTVWVHGSEIQPWWRREYNYNNEAELAPAKIESDRRLNFWREVLTIIPQNLRLVFVSDYFAREVMEDLEITFPEDAYEVIHNPIDTKLFNFNEKDIQQRFKILSIRPYASRKYANDLSVNAVLELSKKDFFKDMIFHFIGDGKLFNEILLPLRDFENVIIEQKFIQQNEISALHKEYGVFLCPTRMDAQGVSKDEAMSSGLIPVTNAVTAIPEFVDDACGILAAGEDAISMANGIEKLVLDPELFKKMSAAAAQRARMQVDSTKILASELRLFAET